MSSLTPWEPFRDMMTLRDAMDRLFEESFVRPRSGWMISQGGMDLAVDMYETKDDVVVKTALPGVKPEDVDINVAGDVLTIRGETKEEKETNEENYLRKERRYGAFSRSVTLPSGLQTEKAEATFDKGVLTLKIPKSEQAKPRNIKVKAKS